MKEQQSLNEYSMRTELTDYIKTLEAMFHGIGFMQYHELAFKFAQINNIDMPAR